MVASNDGQSVKLFWYIRLTDKILTLSDNRATSQIQHQFDLEKSLLKVPMKKWIVSLFFK